MRTLTPKSKRKPLRPKGVFDLEIQPGDRLYFVGEDCELYRGEQCLGRYGYHWEDELTKAVQRTQLALVEGEERPVKGPNVTSMKPEAKAPKAPKAPPKPEEQPQTGERWITIHPNKDNPDSYVRVKIRQHPDGTASVIAGAGGKLNQLRLTKLRSPEEWKERAAERKQKRLEKEEKRRAELSEGDRQAEDDETTQAREYHRGERHRNAKATLDAYQEAGLDHGLTPEHLAALDTPASADTDPEEAKQVEALAREAVQKAAAIQKAYEQRLVQDHDARAAAKLGDESLEGLGNPLQQDIDHTAYGTDGDTISNLTQLPNGQWLVTGGDKADATFDTWQEAAKYHLGNVNEYDGTAGDRSQPDDFYNPKLWVANPDGVDFSPQLAGQMAALALQRKEIDRSDKAAGKAIKKKMPWKREQGFDIGGVSGIDDQAAIAQLDQDAKTIEDALTHGKLLDMAGLLDPQAMAKHLQTGGMAQLGEIASDVLKVAQVDPAIIAQMGHDEAAKLIAYQIRQAVGDREYQAIAAAQAAHHGQWSTEYANQVIAENQPRLDALRDIHRRMQEIEAAKDGDYTADQLIELDTLSYQSETLQKSLQQSIGTALGQLQASAAMTLALESKPRSLRFAVKGSHGDVADVPGLLSTDDSPSIWSSYGLTAEDFSLEDGPDGQLVSIEPSGMEKLATATYNPEDRDAYEEAIAIKRGAYDEDGFTPAGFAYRPESTFTDVRAEAQQFDTTFNYQPEMDDAGVEQAIKQYLGARVANGDDPLSVRRDLFSPELYLNLGLNQDDALRVNGAVQAMDLKLFGKDAPGQAQIRNAYQELGDQAAAAQRSARATDDLQALHSQNLNTDTAKEAAHRALAAMPMARAVLKPMDQLSTQERKYLRDYAITEVMGETLEAPAKKEATPEEDVPQTGSLFDLGSYDEPGDKPANDYREPSQWDRFCRIMGGEQKAYDAIRDRLKGNFYSRFASAYSAIEGKPLLTGSQTLTHVDRLAAASLPPEERDELLAHLRSLDQSEMAQARNRQGGKFAVEMDDWLDKYHELKGKDRQLGLLTTETERQGVDNTQWQRTTLGTQAEQDLNDALQSVLPGFEQVNSAVNIYPEVRWNGGFVAHQRGLKLLERQKKIGMHYSAGSGKTSGMLGAFTHLHSQGKVTRTLVAVPSGILGQAVGECATFLEPGQYSYSANIGWDREKRLEALRNPDMQLHFTTRESLASDLLHLVEKHTGIGAEDFQNTDARSEDDRRSLLLTALQKEGIDPSSLLFSVDEAHDLSRRQGVSPSRRSLVLDALAYHSAYHINATGTPLKNDASEIADFLQKVGAPEVKDVSAFMARYGKNTQASRRSLQRLVAKYAYAIAVKPTTKDGQELSMRMEQPKIALSDHQKTQRAELLKHYDTLQAWREQELPKVMAAKRERGDNSPLNTKDLAHAWEDEGVRAAIAVLSPESYGKLDDATKQVKAGGQLLGASALKYAALSRLYHQTDYANNGKAQHVVKMAAQAKADGKPMVIFAASAQAAQMLRNQLAKEGHRVGYIDGTLGPAEKDKERLRFSPVAGEDAETDILVTTDAAQTGLNLQRGKLLVHYDIPLTQKAWDQRSARIYRRGQTDDVDVHTLVADAPEDAIALARMQRKGSDSELFQGADATQGHAELLDDTGLAAAIAEFMQEDDPG